MGWRAIHSSVAFSSSLAALTAGAERLFWRMLACSDPYGRLPGDPMKLWARCMPIIQPSETEVNGWLEELSDGGRIVRYVAQGVEVIQLADFDKWQQRGFLQRRGSAEFPSPDGQDEIASQLEVDIKRWLATELTEGRILLNGQRALSVQRELRIGNSYADIVATLSHATVIIEVKRGRASAAALRQVRRYGASAGNDALLVIVSAEAPPSAIAAAREDPVVSLVRMDGLDLRTVSGPARFAPVAEPGISRQSLEAEAEAEAEAGPTGGGSAVDREKSSSTRTSATPLDDDLATAIDDLNPSTRQRARWETAARDEQERFRACLTAAAGADKPAAYLDELVKTGQHPANGNGNGTGLSGEERQRAMLREKGLL